MSIWDTHADYAGEHPPEATGGSMFETDDFHTYNAVQVSETYIGCGGEFCPGPNPGDWTDEQWYADTGFTADTLCRACKTGEKRTATGYRAAGMEPY